MRRWARRCLTTFRCAAPVAPPDSAGRHTVRHTRTAARLRGGTTVAIEGSGFGNTELGTQVLFGGEPG